MRRTSEVRLVGYGLNGRERSEGDCLAPDGTWNSGLTSTYLQSNVLPHSRLRPSTLTLGSSQVSSRRAGEERILIQSNLGMVLLWTPEYLLAHEQSPNSTTRGSEYRGSLGLIARLWTIRRIKRPNSVQKKPFVLDISPPPILSNHHRIYQA